MCSQLEVRAIIAQLRDNLARIFPQEQFDVILFGSYARDDAGDGSDIDVMFLVDSSRRTIQEKHWQIGEAAAEVLMDYGLSLRPSWRIGHTTMQMPICCPSSGMCSGKECVSVPEITLVCLSRYRLSKAAGLLETAQRDMNAKDYASVNNRAYYCIFHAMRAVLALDGEDYKISTA